MLIKYLWRPATILNGAYLKSQMSRNKIYKMKKTIVYVASIMMLSSLIQMHSTSCFAQAKVTKSTTAAKLKGILQGHYGLGSQIGEYELSFNAGKYTGIFIPNNGDREKDAILLTDLIVNESLRTITFKKGKEAKIYKGKLDKDFSLVIDGKVFDNFQQDYD